MLPKIIVFTFFNVLNSIIITKQKRLALWLIRLWISVCKATYNIKNRSLTLNFCNCFFLHKMVIMKTFYKHICNLFVTEFSLDFILSFYKRTIEQFGEFDWSAPTVEKHRHRTFILQFHQLRQITWCTQLHHA